MVRIHAFRLTPPPPPRGVGGLLAWIAGVLAGGVALVFGAIFALFTAIAVAILALFAGVAVFAARLLNGRRPARRPMTSAGPVPGEGEVIEAHKVGDQWVAYGFDRQGR